MRELQRKKPFTVLMFVSSTHLTYLCSRLQRQRVSRKDSRRELEEKIMAVVGYTFFANAGKRIFVLDSQKSSPVPLPDSSSSVNLKTLGW